MEGTEQEAEVPQNNVNKEEQREAKGVNSVTDFVADVEIDEVKAKDAVTAYNNTNNNAKKNGEKLVLAEDDIKVIVDECEVSREAAEALLRANGGVLKRALVAFVKD